MPDHAKMSRQGQTSKAMVTVPPTAVAFVQRAIDFTHTTMLTCGSLVHGIRLVSPKPILGLQWEASLHVLLFIVPSGPLSKHRNHSDKLRSLFAQHY